MSATGTRHRSAHRHRSLGRQTIDRIAVAVYGAVDWLVIMGPALAVKLAADRGGMGDTEGLDLVIASALVATPHAIVAARRLPYEERTAVRRADMWLASIDSLVVLALGATIPLVVLLWGITEEHVALSGRGYPIVAIWAGIQLGAVVVAEVVGRLVFWWLHPHPRDPEGPRWRRKG